MIWHALKQEFMRSQTVKEGFKWVTWQEATTSVRIRAAGVGTLRTRWELEKLTNRRTTEDGRIEYLAVCIAPVDEAGAGAAQHRALMWLSVPTLRRYKLTAAAAAKSQTADMMVQTLDETKKLKMEWAIRQIAPAGYNPELDINVSGYTNRRSSSSSSNHTASADGASDAGVGSATKRGGSNTAGNSLKRLKTEAINAGGRQPRAAAAKAAIAIRTTAKPNSSFGLASRGSGGKHQGMIGDVSKSSWFKVRIVVFEPEISYVMMLSDHTSATGIPSARSIQYDASWICACLMVPSIVPQHCRSTRQMISHRPPNHELCHHTDDVTPLLLQALRSEKPLPPGWKRPKTEPGLEDEGAWTSGSYGAGAGAARSNRPFEQLDLVTNHVINVFASVAAVKQAGAIQASAISNIQFVLNGARRTCGGYGWRYVDEDGGTRGRMKSRDGVRGKGQGKASSSTSHSTAALLPAPFMEEDYEEDDGATFDDTDTHGGGGAARKPALAWDMLPAIWEKQPASVLQSFPGTGASASAGTGNFNGTHGGSGTGDGGTPSELLESTRSELFEARNAVVAAIAEKQLRATKTAALVGIFEAEARNRVLLTSSRFCGR
jgi:hypothetical protein